MSVEFEKQMIKLVSDISSDIISKLSKQYKFDPQEAKKILKVPEIKVLCNEEKKQIKKTTIPLPFCGKVFTNCCHAIRLNHGLYTQCNNPSYCFDYEYPVCKTCEKQCEKSTNNTPTYGFIQERLDKGDNYLDFKGKKPINYGNIMEKLEITVEKAREEALKLGMEIPDYQFKIEKVKRGRPKKQIAVDDTPSISDVSSETSEKPKRGRPRKTPKEIVNDDSKESLLEKLKNQANLVDDSDDSEDLNDGLDSNEEGEVSVECIRIEDGKIITLEQNDDGSIPKKTQYLYNPSTKDIYSPSLEETELIGIWNGKKIIYKNDKTD